MNATRYFTCLYETQGKPMKVERVMSPTLAMIEERENEIEAFIPETYYTVNLNIDGLVFESRRFNTEEEAIQVEEKCKKAISTNS